MHTKTLLPFHLELWIIQLFDLTLSQLVFDGQYFVGLKATKVVKQVSEKALVKSEDQIKESVADTYYQLLVLQENIKLLEGKQESS